MTTSNLDSTTCERMEERLSDLVAGTLSDRDLVALSAHLRGCDSCAELFDLHVDLSGLAAAADGEPSRTTPPSIADARPLVPSEREFAAARRRVLEELSGIAGSARVSEIPQTSSRVVAHPSAARWTMSPGVRWAAAAVFALGMFGLGWLSARPDDLATRTENLAFDDARGLPAALLPTNLLPTTLTNGVSSSALPQFEIDNLRLRDVDGDRVAVSFDAATYVETVLPRTDPLVREAVVRSIRGGSDLGGRINAIEQTHSLELSTAVRDALVTAMLDDPDVAVRLQAQQRLAQTEIDGEVVAACLRVLETEESVQMRLLAVDMLSAQRVAPDRLFEAIENGHPEPGNALRVRAANYERLY